jgi:hypothetical protein
VTAATEVLPVAHVMVLVDTSDVPVAPVSLKPLPEHPLKDWVDALPVSPVHFTERAAAPAIPPGMATAATDAEPANAAAHTRRRSGK